MIKLLVDNNQDAFDTALTSIVKQGERCMQQVGGTFAIKEQCAYNNDAGQACAIGQLVAPSDRRCLSNDSVDQLVEDEELYIGDVNLDILSEMQDAHDRCEKYNDEQTAMQNYVEMMEEIANTHLLDTKILNKMKEVVYA